MIWCLVRAKMVNAVSLGSYGSTQHDWHRKYRKLKSKQRYNQLHTVWSECHFCVGFCTNRVFGSKAFTFARCLCAALHAFLWPVYQSVQSKCTSMCLPALCGTNGQVCICLPSVLFVECIMDVSSASDSQHETAGFLWPAFSPGIGGWTPRDLVCRGQGHLSVGFLSVSFLLLFSARVILKLGVFLAIRSSCFFKSRPNTKLFDSTGVSMKLLWMLIVCVHCPASFLDFSVTIHTYAILFPPLWGP